MPWLRTDDVFLDHPKVLAATTYSSEAERLAAKDALVAWQSAALWASLAKSDGTVPLSALRTIATKACLTMGELEAATDRLISAGLWERSRSRTVAFVIHDFAQYNPRRVQLEVPAWKRDRSQELHRSTAGRRIKRAVELRDANGCRYCDVELEEARSSSPAAKTFDHVDPERGNDEDNVVLACKRCNAIKSDRTPDEASMPLLPPRSAR